MTRKKADAAAAELAAARKELEDARRALEEVRRALRRERLALNALHRRHAEVADRLAVLEVRARSLAEAVGSAVL